MDQATRNLRKRNKVLAGKRGELPQFEARGLGRKLKSAETFPLRQCTHVDGGKKVFMRRRRRDGSTYSIPLIIGGTRCPNTASTGQNCPQHKEAS